MKFLKFNLYSLSNIYPFISPIFWFLRDYFSHHTDLSEDIQKKLYFSFIIFFSEFLSIIGLIILYFTTKKEEEENNKEVNNLAINSSKISLIENKTLKSKMPIKKIIIIITIITILDIEDNMNIGDIKHGGWNQDSIRALELIITSFLCNKLLNLPFYNHHLFSIIILLISGILLLLGDSVSLKLKNLLLTILNFLIFSFEIIIESKVLKYISPYFLNTLKGIFGMITVSVINLFYKKDNFKFNILIESKHTLFLILFIISSAFYNLFIELILHDLTPTHIAISESISSILVFLVYNFSTKALNIIGYSLILFASLIYNENIILICFHLDVNTKDSISLRSFNDFNIIQIEE
jgi:hypothetical protein